MNMGSKITEQDNRPEAALSSSFSRAVYSQIEEIGWEHLVRLAEDLSFVTFRVIDKKERVHVLEILLDKSYPTFPPSVSADVPYLFRLEWSTNSRLKDVVKQFRQHLETLQQFWSTMEEIDQSLWVLDAAQMHRATSFRHISIGDDCSIILYIRANESRSLPECRFMGSGNKVNLIRDKWQRNCKKWRKDEPFAENLANMLEFELPGPPGVEKNEQQVECGICYSQFLPIVKIGTRK
nr:E3 ubiquitin-protein ligase FANCL isoform X1 [Tanacetum cinerariifolium]